MFPYSLNKTKQRGSVARGSGTKRGSRHQKSGDSVGAYFGDAWSLAKRTASGLNEIRKLINIEEKVLDTNQASFAFDTNGTVVPVSLVAQGLDFNQRVGDSFKMQNIQFRYRVFRATGATTSVVRIMLVRDLDCQGATPTVGSIIENGTLGTAQAPTSPLRFLNRKRFAVLYDNLTVVTSTDIGFSDSISMAHDGHILFLGTTAVAASQGKGSLFVLVVSDEAANTPTIAFQTRIVFTDD